jgi:hypothetical protein
VFVEGSELRGNNVDAGATSQGGAVYMSAPSSLRLHESQLTGNAALHGLRSSEGGAIFVSGGGGGHLEIVSCALVGNRAFSTDGDSKGGAVSVGDQCESVVTDTDFTGNNATGVRAHGGAIWSGGTSLRVRGTTIAHSWVFSDAYLGEALGAALFLDRGLLDVRDSHVSSNVAEIASPAERASAGGIYLASRAVASLASCRLHSNQASGSGYYDKGDSAEYLRGTDAFGPNRASIRASTALEVYSEGRVQIVNCTSSNAASSVANAAKWLIVANGGSIALHSSRFGARADARLGLLTVLDARSEVLIVGCEVSNLEIRSLGILGVVNSSFYPPLNATGSPAVQPPNCGAGVAGESVCDPRATCEPGPSGGVRCHCSGEGLQTKAGAVPDGRNCQQAPMVDTTVIARTVAFEVLKPSTYGEPVHLSLQAKGESMISLLFGMSMTRISVGLDVPAVTQQIWSRVCACTGSWQHFQSDFGDRSANVASSCQAS